MRWSRGFPFTWLRASQARIWSDELPAWFSFLPCHFSKISHLHSDLNPPMASLAPSPVPFIFLRKANPSNSFLLSTLQRLLGDEYCFVIGPGKMHWGWRFTRRARYFSTCHHFQKSTVKVDENSINVVIILKKNRGTWKWDFHANLSYIKHPKQSIWELGKKILGK